MRRAYLALIVAFFCCLGASAASGALRLRVEDLGTSKGVVLTDQATGDLDAEAGAVEYKGTIGSFSIKFTGVLSKPILGGSDPYAVLHLTNLTVKSSGAGTLRIIAQDTGYPAGVQPDGQAYFESGIGGVFSAPANSKVKAWSWLNLADSAISLGIDKPTVSTLTALAIPGTGIPAGSIPGLNSVFNPGAFSDSATVQFNYTGPATYSMFTAVQVEFKGAGSVSFDVNLSTHAPEPGSFAIWGGLSLLGICVARRRKAARLMAA